MASIQVIATTDKGEQALSRHLSDSKNASWKDKRIFNMMYREETWQDANGRLCLTLTITSKALARLMDPSALAKPIQETMKLNGAIKGADYELSVKA